MLNCKLVNAETSRAAVSENSTAARVGWTVLIVATLYVCYFSHLGAIGFVGPDEPRYAWIARDMAESGDWVTPRLYGNPWFEKPVLYYWGAAASFKLFGVSEAAARLPSALAALLATLSLGWLALRLYGRATARWLLLLLPTSLGMIGFSHAASTDMLFSGMLTVAMVCAALVVGLARTEHSPVLKQTWWLASIAFGFFLGAAVLAKGPAALILSGGAISLWALLSKRWRDAFRLFHPAAVATFLLTALPWYVLCARRNPDFFRIFIIEHNFKRYLTPEFQHIQPFWYYIPVVLLSFFPWIALLLWALYAGISHIRAENKISHATQFLLCWSMFCIVFFSVSHSKLPGYVLPAIPAVGLLLARTTTALASGRQTQLRWVWVATGSMFAILAIVLLRSGQRLFFASDLRPVPAVMITVALAIIAGLSVAYFSRFSAFDLPAILTIASLLALFVLSTNGLRQLDPGVSARQTALASRANLLSLGPAEARTFKLRRNFAYAVNFYVHREVPEWNPDGAPLPDYVLVFSTMDHREELQAHGMFCIPQWSVVISCRKAQPGLL